MAAPTVSKVERGRGGAVAKRGRPPGRPGPRLPEHAVWLAPLLAMATLFFLWPMLNVIRLAFTNTTLLRDEYSYTLDSFSQALTDPSLPTVLLTTVIFVVASVVGQLVLGLLIALIIQRAVARKLRGAVLVRSVVLSAWVMPGILIGVIWQIVLNEGPFGLVNAFVNRIGLDPISWLSDTKLAVLSVVTANIWRGTAFTMLLLYAALLSVNAELYDAAKVDGARKLRTLWHVTLPQIRPVLLVNTVLITIATLNTFDMVLALTGGGPAQSTEVLALHTYNAVFVNFNLAGGCVFALMLLFASLLLTAGYRRLLAEEEL
jgi:multiple sugar transport system permease protein